MAIQTAFFLYATTILYLHLKRKEIRHTLAHKILIGYAWLAMVVSFEICFVASRKSLYICFLFSFFLYGLFASIVLERARRGGRAR